MRAGVPNAVSLNWGDVVIPQILIMSTASVLPTNNCTFDHAVLTECVLGRGHNGPVRTAVWTVRVCTRSGQQVFGVGGGGGEPSDSTRREHR